MPAADAAAAAAAAAIHIRRNVADNETRSHMEATGLNADQVDEETGWICDEIWDYATQEQKNILWDLTQAVHKRRRDDAAAAGNNAVGNGGAADPAAGEDARRAADEDVRRVSLPALLLSAEDAEGVAAAVRAQKQRMVRSLDVMCLKIADVQRQITWMRRQLD